MATLYIEEFSHVGQDGNGITAQIPQYPAIATQTVTFTATSAASASFNDSTRLIVVRGDAAFHYVVGDSPTATTSNMVESADKRIPLGVRPGQGLKIAARTTA